MSEILTKLEQLTSLTGIDFSEENSFHYRIISALPDPEGTLIRISLFITELIYQFSADPTKLQTLIQNYFKEEVFKEIALLFSNSPILARYLLKNPDSFVNIFPIDKVTVEEYTIKQKEITQRLQGHLNNKRKDQAENNQLENVYRQIREEKIRQFLTIAGADYTGIDTFEETVAKITLFAETTIAYALEFSKLDHFPVAVIAMGKLGGQELNYNSDIDLMFIAADNIAEIIDSKTMTAMIHRFIDILDRLTADGFVFKVDLRIRPEGTQGPLFMTFKQYERYYQTRAQSWEFQALIKARAVGGDPDLGQKFESFRKCFVFTPDFSSRKMLFSIARIKNTIETYHNSQGYDDVKLSPGGIRDLEFTVQFLQIHHGKITRVLDSSNTLSTLDKFLAYRIISPKQHRDFKNHYCFLRRIEHYLQLIDLQAIRLIPQSPRSLRVISRMLGYENSEEFRNRVKKVMDYNRNLFVRTFKLTVAFYEKIEDIRKQIQADTFDKNEKDAHSMFEKFTNHLESDYFLNFDTPVIIEHIRMMKRFTENQSHLELSLSLEDTDALNEDQGRKIYANLITHDYTGIFSLICAIFSSYGINIQNGASFLYQSGDRFQKPTPNVNKKSPHLKSKPAFTSRLFWNRVKSNPASDFKKIVFSMEGMFIHRQAQEEFNEQNLKETFAHTLKQVKEGKYIQAMDGVILKSIESMKKYGLHSGPQQLKPIHMRVDNESHPLYTLIDIDSEDSFLFLFIFTYTLSSKDYYIVKVEFSTPKNRIRNRIFLTNKRKEKIQSMSGILELKSSILIIKYFSTFMAHAPNPALAYKTFTRLIKKTDLKESKNQDYHQLFQDIAKILGTGEVIMEDFLRLQHSDIRDLLNDKKKNQVPLTPGYLEKKMSQAFKEKESVEDPIVILNQFKDKYLFRLDLRLLTGEIRSFGEFCSEMTNLTDVVMTQAIEIALSMSRDKFQDAFTEQTPKEPGRHALIALGKWGSREMGYASDVELVFVYDGYQDSDGKVLTPINEFYIYLGNQIPKVIRSKKNGVFELDFRLRPEGDSSILAVSLDKYRNYYQQGGSYLNYEKMVLSRLRIVSNTGGLGEEIEAIKNHFVYQVGDFDLDNYFSLRQKQIKHLIQPKNEVDGSFPSHPLHLKFSPGGLVEIEYLLQILSIVYGKDNPQVRKSDTLGIAQALLEEGLIEKTVYRKIVDSYKFLRNLINCIRIIRGNAKDMLMPKRDHLEMEYLKRTMVNFHTLKEDQDLYEVLHQVMDQVNKIHNDLLSTRLIQI